MRGNLTRSFVAATAALALGAGVAVSTSGPAEAQYYYRHGGYYHHGGGDWGWGLAAGLLGGAVIGSAIANNNNYSYGPGPGPGPRYYGDSCWRPRPVYDRWGNYVGRRMVDVCY